MKNFIQRNDFEEVERLFCSSMFRLAFFLSPILMVAITSAAQAQRAFSDEVLKNPKVHAGFYERRLPIYEVPVYIASEAENKVILENGYAKYKFKNRDEWPLQGQKVKAVKINVIFTQYPKDISFWLTNYHWLLSKRLSELFSIDTNLNSEQIDYIITLQTDCDNEFEAQQLFHGIEITYIPAAELKEKQITEEQIEKSHPTMKSNSNIRKLKLAMLKAKFKSDSTVIKVFERNKERWQNALLVMDWTGSMRGYGAEALLWHTVAEENSFIDQCAFFNDGDRKKTRDKEIGYTGGVYYCNANPVSQPIKLMQKVQNKGTGGDSPENDVEALIRSIQDQEPEGDIILLADNTSCIRDYVLLSCIDKPIHIVLCGTKNGVNHQYINLAWKTGGSVHTGDEDIYKIDSLAKLDQLVINGVRYTITNRLLITPVLRQENYFAPCDRYYDMPRRKVKSKKRREPECYFSN